MIAEPAAPGLAFHNARATVLTSSSNCSASLSISAPNAAGPAKEPAAASVLDEAAQPLAPARVAQLAQRLSLDLADALAGDLEVLAHLFQRVVGLLADAEAHAQHLLLARGERGQHLAGLLGQVHRDHRVRR